ncbi:hypothetical protein FOL46_000986 [Perkinsus olseni]|uniref:Uncharacterized protein n=1 Tax=Perkinsus olseni TaxID=32597 RepID=A0A7J6KSS9_PEROL|nr:hypothetical protein FOL46_000986 [Perkinsus olseni]
MEREELRKKQAEDRVREEALAREAAEIEARRSQEAQRLSEVKKDEELLLEKHSRSLRHYLLQNVMPTLKEGIVEACEKAPEDGVTFLAESGPGPADGNVLSLDVLDLTFGRGNELQFEAPPPDNTGVDPVVRVPRAGYSKKLDILIGLVGKLNIPPATRPIHEDWFIRNGHGEELDKMQDVCKAARAAILDQYATFGASCHETYRISEAALKAAEDNDWDFDDSGYSFFLVRPKKKDGPKGAIVA